LKKTIFEKRQRADEKYRKPETKLKNGISRSGKIYSEANSDAEREAARCAWQLRSRREKSRA